MDDNRKISIEEAKKEVELAGRRIGLLHLAYAETLVEEFGEKEGKEKIFPRIPVIGPGSMKTCCRRGICFGASAGIQLNTDCGFVIGDSIKSEGRGFDIWVVKFDEVNSLQWEKTYGTDEDRF